MAWWVPLLKAVGTYMAASASGTKTGSAINSAMSFANQFKTDKSGK